MEAKLSKMQDILDQGSLVRLEEFILPKTADPALVTTGAVYISLQGTGEIKVPIPLSVNFTKHPGEVSFYPGITGIPVTLQEGSTVRQAGNYNRYHGASASIGFGD
ncbi:hypothetical protein MRX96_014173 [Rhipicephalus microplus]